MARGMGMAIVLFMVAEAAWANPPSRQEREQIGTVLGKPVYREQLGGAKEGRELQAKLQELFGSPWMKAYQEKHKGELEPTEAELQHAEQVFARKHAAELQGEEPKLRARLKEVQAALADPKLDAQRKGALETEKLSLEIRLKPPGREFAKFLLGNWKWQKFLHDRHGGGRILWQQMGVEAFDATHQWLKAHEAKGDFTIADPKLRKAFYFYWAEQNHGPFLTDDPERIRKEFLEPEWALPAKGK